MSRLYGHLFGDSKKERTLGAHETLEAQINWGWGSRGDSKTAVNVMVRWPMGQDTPTVYITTGTEIKELVVNGATQ